MTSPFQILVLGRRFLTSSILVLAPSGTLSLGQSSSLTISGLIWSPVGISAMATKICWVSTSDDPSELRLAITCVMPIEATSPHPSASISNSTDFARIKSPCR